MVFARYSSSSSRSVNGAVNLTSDDKPMPMLRVTVDSPLYVHAAIESDDFTVHAMETSQLLLSTRQCSSCPAIVYRSSLGVLRLLPWLELRHRGLSIICHRR